MSGQAKVYEVVTERILEALDAGEIPWRKTWYGGASGRPRNLVTDRPYRGFNVMMLAMAPYGSPYWLSFKQAKDLGGHVKKGEKGTPIVFFKFDEREDKEGEKYSTCIVRYYRVFNLEQTEGVRVPKGRETEPEEVSEFEAHEDGERVFDAYVTSQRVPVAWGGDAAYYAPKEDRIQLPKREHFDDPAAYYSTAFHEATHSTGHESRLARKGIVEIDAFGSHQYADEELVAEFGASYLCGMAGIERDGLIENQAAYIRSWSKRLRADRKLVVWAAQRAQKAADYILEAKPVEAVEAA